MKSLRVVILALSLVVSVSWDTASEAKPNSKLLKGKVSVTLQKAQSLFGERKYAEAAALFKEQINKNSKDVDAYAGLGMSLAMQFKLDGAGEAFDRALEQNPLNAQALAGKAMCGLYRLQSSDQSIIANKQNILMLAETNARDAVEADPAYAESRYILGKILLEQSKESDAIQAFYQALELDPQHSPSLAALAQQDLKNNQLEQAEAKARNAIAANSGNATAHYVLGEVLLRKESYPEAIKELNTSLYQHRNSEPVHVALGKAYEAQGNYAAALKQFERAALIKPENNSAYSLMANLHVKLGQRQMRDGSTVGALKEFKQALLLDPQNPVPYMAMADLREQRGEIELANAELHSGLELNPGQPDLHIRLGQNHLKSGSLDDAIAEYEKGLKGKPNDAQAVHGLTQALYLKAQGQSQAAFFASSEFENAEATLQRAAKLRPSDLTLQLAIAKLNALAGRRPDLSKLKAPHTVPEKLSFAEALLAQNKFDESASRMDELIQNIKSTKDALAVAELAMLNMDHNSAEAAFRKAAELGATERANFGLAAVARLKQSAQTKLHLGDDLARKNQLASAADAYRDAITADPRLSSARLGLARVEERLAPKSSESLRNAVTQYEAFLALEKTISEKDRERLTKHVGRVNTRIATLDAKSVAGK